MSWTGIENEGYYQLKKYGLDITRNSHNYLTKNSMVLVERINVSIVGMKGLK